MPRADKPLRQVTRQQVVDLIIEGYSQNKIATKLGISQRSVNNLLNNHVDVIGAAPKGVYARNRCSKQRCKCGFKLSVDRASRHELCLACEQAGYYQKQTVKDHRPYVAKVNCDGYAAMSVG